MKHRELIQSLMDCVISCRHCAAACLGEEAVDMMANCIRTDFLCADVCETTAKVLIADAGDARDLVSYCMTICRNCAEECNKHDHEHCKDCAEFCINCMEACRNFVSL